jgi:hypothetical protein
MTLSLPRYRVRFVHLTALWAYGVSQPGFALVKGNPDLLLARNATWSDVAVFVVLVAVVPPLLLTGYVWLASRISRWVGDVLYLVLLGACSVPVAARLVKLADPGFVVAVALMLLVASAGVAVYARSRAVRLFLGYSIVLPLAGVAWFVHGLPTLSEEAHAASVRVTSDVPVVFVVLDELPASSLMTLRGEIDAVRYPSFARLARRSTWYSNATTVHEWTSDAVPALLSGRVGGVSTLPTADHHPDTLFSLLGRSYAFEVDETMTQLCPDEYCRRARNSVVENGVGLVRDSWRLTVPRVVPASVAERIVHVNADILLESDSTRSLADFLAFVGGISRDDPDRTLYYSHLFLPHAPWMYLPSGARYDFRGIDGWSPQEYWQDDAWLVLQGYQRHLLQVGYVDRLLGRLLRSLEREGIFDRALVVVVADHGSSFRAGEGRRPVSEHNFADIASVPLFVKYPNQRRGRVDPRAARTTDLVPTIADVLHVRLPWTADGESLLGPADGRRDVVVSRRGGAVSRLTLDAMIRDRRTTVRAKTAAFGEGRDSLYGIGTNTQLLGVRVGAVSLRSRSVEVRLDGADELVAVRPASGYLPVRISGRVVAGRVAQDDELAIGVNGRVVALTRCFPAGRTQRFRAMVPEAALLEGRNSVDVFLVRGSGDDADLVRVGSNRDRAG